MFALDRTFNQIMDRQSILADKYFPREGPLPRPIKAAMTALNDTLFRINRRTAWLKRELHKRGRW